LFTEHRDMESAESVCEPNSRVTDELSCQERWAEISALYVTDIR